MMIFIMILCVLDADEHRLTLIIMDNKEHGSCQEPCSYIGVFTTPILLLQHDIQRYAYQPDTLPLIYHR